MLAKYYQLLKHLVSYKTISGDADSTQDIQSAASWLESICKENGMRTSLVEGYGNPIVWAEYQVDSKLPTCLIYGHYDVQYANKSEGRKHSPFSLHIGRDKIFGRGVADNKGQFLIHLITIFDLIQSQQLAYNVVFIIEGNEETGSSDIEKFLKDYSHQLKSDFCLVSDSNIVGTTPCIDAGYRGGFNAKLTIKTAKTDLHSGEFGGIVPNSIHEMSKILQKLHDVNNRVTIPYFYYDVEDVDIGILVKNKRIKFDHQKLMDNAGLRILFKDKNYDFVTQVGLRPTVQVTGVQGGYFGEGYKNAVPKHASAHFNFRLVKNQNAAKMVNAFEQWLQLIMPAYVDYDLEVSSPFEPCKVDLNNQYVKKAERTLESVYGQGVVHKYSGGSLPVVGLLQKIVSDNLVLVPLVNEDSNIHGIDENFDIALIEKGFEFSYAYLGNPVQSGRLF